MSIIQDYKEILQKEGFKGKKIAEMLKIKYSSYRTMTKNKRDKHPKWIGSFVLGYRLRDLKEVERENVNEPQSVIKEKPTEKTGGWRERLKSKTK